MLVWMLPSHQRNRSRHFGGSDHNRSFSTSSSWPCSGKAASKMKQRKALLMPATALPSTHRDDVKHSLAPVHPGRQRQRFHFCCGLRLWTHESKLLLAHCILK